MRDGVTDIFVLFSYLHDTFSIVTMYSTFKKNCKKKIFSTK